MQRIGVAERRARLLSRHRLAPAERGADRRGRPLPRCLHSTDAATVFLLSWRGAAASRPATSSERCTRSAGSSGCSGCDGRSGWSRASSPGGLRGCTRAAREQRKGWSGSSPKRRLERPGPWITWRRRRPRCARRAWRGDHVEVTQTSRCSRRAPPRHRQVGGRAERRRTRAAADGDRGTDRPRRRPARGPPGSSAGSRPRTGLAGRSRSGTSPRRRRSCSAAGSRPSGRRPRRTSAGGRAGRPARRGPRSPRSRTPGRPRRAERLRPRRRPRADLELRARRRAAADPRPDDDGLEGARLVPRPARPHALRHERQRRTDRLVGRPRRRRLGQRRDGEIVYRLLEDVGADAVAAVEAEAAAPDRLGRRRRFSPGFLPPFQRALGEG